ncbi:hypothetical protein TSOC_014666, partial [Tetrabaena socialis]
VVLLGSGLDARPWRLPLPPGVAWFEVDRRDVLAAKRARLGALGAGTEPGREAGPERVGPGRPGRAADAQGREAEAGAEAAAAAEAHVAYGSVRLVRLRTATDPHGDGVVVRLEAVGAPPLPPPLPPPSPLPPLPPPPLPLPLRAARWRCCAVDLRRRGWSRGLVAGGLDPAAPVLWVAEGLLYYLEEADVRAVLQEAASISARGSVLAASIIRLQEPSSRPTPAPTAAAAAPSSTSAAAPSSPPDPSGSAGATTPAGAPAGDAPAAGKAGAADGSSGAAAAGGGGGAAAPGGGVDAAAGTAASGAAGGPAGGAAGAARGLQNEFKWRCRGDVSE